MHLQHDAAFILDQLKEECGRGTLEDPNGITILSSDQELQLDAGDYHYILLGPGKTHSFSLQTPGSASAAQLRPLQCS